MPPCHYPLVPEVFSRVQRDASWPKPEVSGTQLYPVIKHFYLTVAKVILCHSHATSLYLNTCYAIYNLQCRIERAILCESGAKDFMRDWKTRKTVSLLKSPSTCISTCIWPVHHKVSCHSFLFRDLKEYISKEFWKVLSFAQNQDSDRKGLLPASLRILVVVLGPILILIKFLLVSVDAFSDSSGCVFRAAEYNVHTNPNSHSLANKFLNGACLLYINKTELCYDSHLAAARENCEKKKLQSVFFLFTLKQVAQCRTRPTIQITVDSR